MSDYNEDFYLQPDIMLHLYSEGAFPMTDDKGIIQWYFPSVRAIIPISNYNIPKSLRKYLSTSDFSYKIDCDFLSVVRNCANRETTWINQKLIEAYRNLWDLGFIHTVEVYQNDDLVGGLYGISIGGVFFGESMFSKVPQASKAAFAHLLKYLEKQKFLFVDVQIMTEHLKMFGAIEVSLELFQNMLEEAYSDKYRFT